MNRRDAERIVAVLDNLSARCRDIEVGIDRIRREIQDDFRVAGYGHTLTQTGGRASQGAQK